MSDYASVIVTWSGVGEALPMFPAAYQNKYRAALDKVCGELGLAKVLCVSWACGAGGDTYCCENVATLSVNHFGPWEFYPAVGKHALFLLAVDQQLQAFYKTEDMDRYAEIDPAKLTQADYNRKEN